MFLQTLLNVIIQEYFITNHSRCLVLISEQDLVLTPIDFPIIALNNQYEDNLLDALNMGCDSFIINEPKIEFINIFRHLVQISEQRNGLRKLVFVMEHDVEPFFENQVFFQDFPNVLVIQKDSEGLELTKLNVRINLTLYGLLILGRCLNNLFLVSYRKTWKNQ